LGFGTLRLSAEFGGPALIDPSGTIHPLKDTSGNGTAFTSLDATYIQVQADTTSGNAVVTYKNGTQVFYSGTSPVKIEDSTGNFIAINYNGAISSVVDTTGRTFNFIYGIPGATGALACITDGATCTTSGAHTYTFNWTQYTLHYNFAKYLAQGVFQDGNQFLVISSVTRPDGTKVQFNYGDWGIVTDIQEFSNNGTLREETSYNFPAASAGTLSGPPVYTQKIVTTFDANGNKQPATWSYQEATANPTPGSNIVTCFAVIDPAKTISMTTFSAAGDGFDGIPVQTITATGSAAPCSTAPTKVLRTVNNQWTSDQDSSGKYTGVNARLLSLTTILEDGTTQLQTQFAGYDVHGNLTDLKTFDFGNGGLGPLLRETVISYATNVSNIFNLPADIQIKDSGGNVLSHQTFVYDDYSKTAIQSVTPLPSGFDSGNPNFAANSTTPRGNLTGSTVYVNAAAGTGPISSTFTYDMLGNRLTSQSGCCTQAASLYSATTQYAYPDSVSVGPSASQLTTSFTYDMTSGRVATVTDANGQKTQTSYDVDSRPASSTSPDGITTTYAYDDASANPGVSVSSTANTRVMTSIADFLGRPLTREILNGGSVVSTTSYINDVIGRATQVSNPYGPGETAQYTALAYDALSRRTSLTPPALAGSNKQNPYQTQYSPTTYADAAGTSHSGIALQTIDPAGQPRLRYFDALGRLARVDDPVGGSVAISGTGSATVLGSEQSAQVLSTPATSGTGSVQVNGNIQWAAVASATTAGTTNITINGAEQQNPTGITPGTGSVTIGGSEQVVPAVAATGSVTINGNLQSTQVQTQAATAGTGSVTISGSEQSTTTVTYGPPCTVDPYTGVESCTERDRTTFDTGTVTITVNGHQNSVSFGASDTSNSIASNLTNAINGDGGAVVNASLSGPTVYLTARSTGAATNYSLSGSSSSSMRSFAASASGSSLTGGQNTQYTTVYDSGTCTITVANRSDGNSWSGSGTTAAGIASALAGAINGDAAATVNASASSNVVNLATKNGGAAGDYSLSSSCSYDSGHFGGPSFAPSNSGSSLAGGKDPVYDSGTFSLTVNGHTTTPPTAWNSASTPASIASDLATKINADTAAFVTASVSGNAVNLTATTKGTISNYSFSVASTYDSAHFSHPSFSNSDSGVALTGGSPNNNAVDSGTMTVTVNSKPYQVPWGQGDNAASIANKLVTAIGVDTSVTPTLSNNTTVVLNPKTAGTQYSFSTGYTYDTADFSHTSFTTANSISDAGATTITVNGHNDSVFWSSASTPTSIAAALAGQINGDSGAAVNATASGSTVSLTARTTGVVSNYTLASSTAHDTAHFGANSFATSNSGTTLAGGTNAVYNTVYDSGTVTLTVNGTGYTTTYGQNDTAGAIASRLAASINGGGLVNAAVSGGKLVLTADGSGVATNYSVAASSSSSQPNLFSSASFSDSLSGSTLTGGADGVAGSLSNPLSTFYSYDALGNLLQVAQGQQTRTYTYDSLGRVTSACIPETAGKCSSATYTDFGAAKTTTDPRNVTTTFGFDSLNHVNDVTYSDGTPEVKFTYGAAGAANNGAGRLISSSDGTGSKSYQYDAMGRKTQVSTTLGGNNYVTKYSYSSGQLSSITYPSASATTSGTQVTYNYDAIGRLNTVVVAGTTVYSVNSYNGAGAPLTTSFGNGMAGTYGYNNQLQLASIQFGSTTTPLMNLTYNYGGTVDNGQIQEITDNLVSARSTSYAYDPLGRLQQAQTVDQTSPNTWNLQFGYDRYSNRLSETAVGGTAGMPNSQLTVDPTTNHITTGGFAYDAAGNMISDSIFNYTFDGVNRITSVTEPGTTTPIATYAYDEAGRRVNRNGNLYVYSGSQVIAEYANGTTAGSPSAEYIYAGGMRVATLINGALTYPYWDQLSIRANADASASVIGTSNTFPFGENMTETGSGLLAKWKFTTYERDVESGLDYAVNRFYGSAAGRFYSPDPLAGSVGNPQSLNRYAYVLNDPVNSVDPLGLGNQHVAVPPPIDYTLQSREFDFLQILLNQVSAQINQSNQSGSWAVQVTGSNTYYSYIYDLNGQLYQVIPQQVIFYNLTFLPDPLPDLSKTNTTFILLTNEQEKLDPMNSVVDYFKWNWRDLHNPENEKHPIKRALVHGICDLIAQEGLKSDLAMYVGGGGTAIGLITGQPEIAGPLAIVALAGGADHYLASEANKAVGCGF
jgi:RHS repeat-associated protein